MLNRRIRNLATLALSITALIAGLALTAGPASAAANPCTSGCFLAESVHQLVRQRPVHLRDRPQPGSPQLVR